MYLLVRFIISSCVLQLLLSSTIRSANFAISSSLDCLCLVIYITYIHTYVLYMMRFSKICEYQSKAKQHYAGCIRIRYSYTTHTLTRTGSSIKFNLKLQCAMANLIETRRTIGIYCTTTRRH